MNRQISNLQSRSRLNSSIKKSLETSFIGALAKIEEHFGHLWGHNKKPEELTEEEQKFRKIWLRTREEILYCGNKEINRASNELDKYVIQYNNYQYKFQTRESFGDNHGNR